MSQPNKPYLRIVDHYEACLARYGDTHRGVDWPDAEDALTRYRVMLDLIETEPPRPIRLLDFGCGAAHLLDFVKEQGISGIDYVGLDLSSEFVSLAERKHPGVPFYRRDVLDSTDGLPSVDYVIANGVFIEKLEMSQDEMERLLQQVLAALWPLAKRGLAFNAMSTAVDQERSDLFHLSFDRAAEIITATCSRHFAFRRDYGLSEFTAYVYREA